LNILAPQNKVNRAAKTAKIPTGARMDVHILVTSGAVGELLEVVGEAGEVVGKGAVVGDVGEVAWLIGWLVWSTSECGVLLNVKDDGLLRFCCLGLVCT